MTNYYKTVPGAQLTPAERDFIFSRARGIEEDLSSKFAMCQIGVLWGASLWCIRQGAPHSLLVGVDIDLRRTHKSTSDRIQHEDELWDTALIEAESASYGHIFEQPLSLLMIDGDHHYVQVQADIDAWVPHVVKGGIVIFHDYSPTQRNLKQFPELEGVKRAVDEYFENDKDWERIEGPDSIVAFRRLR